jgi:putative ABC transport system ATP-binding protein
MGPSGSGKTTLLNLVGGIDQPSRGQVLVHGTDIAQLRRPSLAQWRSRNIGFIFQLYNLIPVLTALENVELPLLLVQHERRRARKRARPRSSSSGSATRSSHYPRQLSGGQEQRVAIARAHRQRSRGAARRRAHRRPRPQVGRGDPAAARALNREFKKTIVMVTHDPHAAERATRRPPRQGRAVRLSRAGRPEHAQLVLVNLFRNTLRTFLTMRA